jgi:hypothetical protein
VAVKVALFPTNDPTGIATLRPDALFLAIRWLLSRDWTLSLVAFCVLALLSLSILLGTG